MEKPNRTIPEFLREPISYYNDSDKLPACIKNLIQNHYNSRLTKIEIMPISQTTREIMRQNLNSESSKISGIETVAELKNAIISFSKKQSTIGDTPKNVNSTNKTGIDIDTIFGGNWEQECTTNEKFFEEMFKRRKKLIEEMLIPLAVREQAKNELTDVFNLIPKNGTTQDIRKYFNDKVLNVLLEQPDEEISTINNLIEKLSSKDALTLDDKKDILNLWNIYNNLDDTKKKLISIQNKEKIDDLITKMIVVMVAELPEVGNINSDDHKRQAQEVLNLYNKLNSIQMSNIAPYYQKKIETIKNKLKNDGIKTETSSPSTANTNPIHSPIDAQKIDYAKVDRVNHSILTLPKVENVTFDNRTKLAVENANKWYDELTNDEKRQIDGESVKKLRTVTETFERLRQNDDYLTHITIVQNRGTVPMYNNINGPQKYDKVFESLLKSNPPRIEVKPLIYKYNDASEPLAGKEISIDFSKDGKSNIKFFIPYKKFSMEEIKENLMTYSKNAKNNLETCLETSLGICGIMKELNKYMNENCGVNVDEVDYKSIRQSYETFIEGSYLRYLIHAVLDELDELRNEEYKYYESQPILIYDEDSYTPNHQTILCLGLTQSGFKTINTDKLISGAKYTVMLDCKKNEHNIE